MWLGREEKEKKKSASSVNSSATAVIRPRFCLLQSLLVLLSSFFIAVLVSGICNPFFPRLSTAFLSLATSELRAQLLLRLSFYPSTFWRSVV